MVSERSETLNYKRRVLTGSPLSIDALSISHLSFLVLLKFDADINRDARKTDH
jgi:hypothetical protein